MFNQKRLFSFFILALSSCISPINAMGNESVQEFQRQLAKIIVESNHILLDDAQEQLIALLKAHPEADLNYSFKVPLIDNNYCIETPLLKAIILDRQDLVETLLAYKADPNVHHPSAGTPPLIEAVYRQSTAIAQMLISAGADVNTQIKTPTNSPLLNTLTNLQGLTALHVAASALNIELLKLLLDNGADVTIANARNRTPIEAIIIGDCAQAILLLEEHGDRSLIDDSPKKEKCMLYLLRNGKLSILSWLIDQKRLDVNGMVGGEYPIVHVLQAPDPKCATLELLMHRGAHLQCKTSRGLDPISCYVCCLAHAKNYKPSIITWILAHGGFDPKIPIVHRIAIIKYLKDQLSQIADDNLNTMVTLKLLVCHNFLPHHEIWAMFPLLEDKNSIGDFSDSTFVYYCNPTLIPILKNRNLNIFQPIPLHNEQWTVVNQAGAHLEQNFITMLETILTYNYYTTPEERALFQGKWDSCVKNTFEHMQPTLEAFTQAVVNDKIHTNLTMAELLPVELLVQILMTAMIPQSAPPAFTTTIIDHVTKTISALLSAQKLRSQFIEKAQRLPATKRGRTVSAVMTNSQQVKRVAFMPTTDAPSTSKEQQSDPMQGVVVDSGLPIGALEQLCVAIESAHVAKVNELLETMPYLNPLAVTHSLDEVGCNLVTKAEQLNNEAMQTYKNACARKATAARGEKIKNSMMNSALERGTQHLEVLELLLARVNKLNRDATMYRSSVAASLAHKLLGQPSTT